MLINMTIKRKKTTGRMSLPSKWKMKVFTDNSSGKLRLSAQLRQWLESHEHFHGNREILAVISGRALLSLAGRPVRISRGDFLVIDPWVRHTSGHLPDDSAVFWWCMLKAGRFRSLLWRHNRIDSYQIMESDDLVRLLDVPK
ncbi:MAG: cupin domain-containing protein, partial [Lentisphaerae bacterium]|nr:cupin domain-containing protein [Lentisphaerota bacterium]